jgi:hypothetical protein
LLRDLQVTLKNLPLTLDATYERILSQIHITNQPHARRLFNWLALSVRPLHVEELAQVLAIDFVNDANATFQEDYIEPDAREAISRVCLSLVHITPDGTVQFAHFSVKEFLFSERLKSKSSMSQFRIEAEMAHTIIAASCLAYILWLGSRDDIPKDLNEINIQHPLAKYSIQNAVWAHFPRVSENIQDMLESLFIEDSPQWMFWVSHNAEYNQQSAAPPVYWAAHFGLLSIIPPLLERGADINAQGGKYGNPLQAASQGGHLDVARLLLDRGADVNTEGGEYRNALQAALERGHIEIARLLLDNGADVNAQGGEYGNHLHTASERGYLHIAQLLLEHGADVNAQAALFGTALQAASRWGHLDVAQLLLDHGADVNAQGGWFGTALQAASKGRHNNVAQLLIKYGAHSDPR